MSEKVWATFSKASSASHGGKYKLTAKSGHKGKVRMGLMSVDGDEDPERCVAPSSEAEDAFVGAGRVR